MNINHEEALRILRLIAFADSESMAGNEDLRFALRLLDNFPNQEYGTYRADFEKTLAYVSPPAPPPEMLDLSVAHVIPGIWPENNGQKELDRWW